MLYPIYLIWFTFLLLLIICIAVIFLLCGHIGYGLHVYLLMHLLHVFVYFRLFQLNSISLFLFILHAYNICIIVMPVLDLQWSCFCNYDGIGNVYLQMINSCFISLCFIFLAAIYWGKSEANCGYWLHFGKKSFKETDYVCEYSIIDFYAV